MIAVVMFALLVVSAFFFAFREESIAPKVEQYVNCSLLSPPTEVLTTNTVKRNDAIYYLQEKRISRTFTRDLRVFTPDAVQRLSAENLAAREQRNPHLREINLLRERLLHLERESWDA